MRDLAALVMAMTMSLSPLAVTSCHFFLPPVVENNTSEEASFDGNVANSGIIRSRANLGFEVTPHFRNRYNILIDGYGPLVFQGLQHDAGLTPIDGGNWVIDKQHMVYFLDMNQMRKNGVAPRTK